MLVNLKEILKIAEQDKSAIGMFNATGFDSLQAVVSAAEELNKPVALNIPIALLSSSAIFNISFKFTSIFLSFLSLYKAR